MGPLKRASQRTITVTSDGAGTRASVPDGGVGVTILEALFLSKGHSSQERRFAMAFKLERLQVTARASIYAKGSYKSFARTDVIVFTNIGCISHRKCDTATLIRS
jgi:hypothetical protein